MTGHRFGNASQCSESGSITLPEPSALMSLPRVGDKVVIECRENLILVLGVIVQHGEMLILTVDAACRRASVMSCRRSCTRVSGAFGFGAS
jgi:hypothetical protein